MHTLVVGFQFEGAAEVADGLVDVAGVAGQRGQLAYHAQVDPACLLAGRSGPVVVRLVLQEVSPVALLGEEQRGAGVFGFALLGQPEAVCRFGEELLDVSST